MNTSIFFIDGVIELSNALITAITKVSGTSSCLGCSNRGSKTGRKSGIGSTAHDDGICRLSVILLVYYVGRLVTLYIGAVLSPLIALVWLIPGFRDFAETAIKTYLTTIFVLFVHVVILQLAASLLTGMAPSSGNDVPNTLMAIVVGFATIRHALT
jgi:hypothetical protein